MHVFEEDYAVSFVDSCVTKIFGDLMSSNVSAAKAKAIDARYIPVVRIMIKIKGIRSLLVSLAINAPVVKTLRITHLGLHTPTEEEVPVRV